MTATEIQSPDMSSSWPIGLPRSLDYPDCGADAILAGAARSYPDRLALVDGDTSLTFSQLHDQALRVAQGLRERGVQPGDAVGLHMPNSIWFIVAYYGTLCAGAAVAPMNPAQPVAELKRQLDDVDAKVVFTHPSCAATAIEVNSQSTPPRILVLVPGADAQSGHCGGLTSITDLASSKPLADYRVDPELVAHLQLTGGTTGKSKAVRVLHRNLVANVLQSACWRSGHRTELVDGALLVRPIDGAVTRYSIVPGEGASISIAPLFHGLGLVSHNFTTLLGGTVVLGTRFDPDRFLADVDRYQVTYIGGSPTMYYALLRARTLREHDLGSVRILGSGAAPLDTTAIRTLREVFPNALVTEGYGLSEATMGLTMGSPCEERPTPLGSVGLPFPDTEIQIRDEVTEAVLATGETGQIWARGPQITDGYHNEPELSAGQFIDGWLHTGDMGWRDEQGNLFIGGRSKDLIIYKGYNVYPQPLEELVCTHPDVLQAAVVGAPDQLAGEIPVAFVVVDPESVDRIEQIATEIMDHVATQVAPYQKIREVYVLDELPSTQTGKIRKNELRDSLAP